MSDLHSTIERRLLAPYQVALLLDNGSLSLMDSQTGMQIYLEAPEAYSLLDLLYNHRDLLHQITQGTGGQTSQEEENPEDYENVAHASFLEIDPGQSEQEEDDVSL